MTMSKPLIAFSALALLSLSGCGWSQEEYHAAIRQQCQEKGLQAGTAAFQECFAKELHDDHSYAPSMSARFRGHDWRHDME
jgi:hypothetical protein